MSDTLRAKFNCRDCSSSFENTVRYQIHRIDEHGARLEAFDNQSIEEIEATMREAGNVVAAAHALGWQTERVIRVIRYLDGVDIGDGGVSA